MGKFDSHLGGDEQEARTDFRVCEECMSLEARFRFESPVSSGPFPQFVIVPCRLPAFPIFICACARLMIASFLSPLRAVSVVWQ